MLLPIFRPDGADVVGKGMGLDGF